MYKINGVDLSIFGFIPIKADGSDLAITGCFDLPKRKGDVEYFWGSEVESFLESEDIEIAENTFAISGLFKGESAVNSAKDLIRLVTENKENGIDAGFLILVAAQHERIVCEKLKDSVLVKIGFVREYGLPDLVIEGTGGDGFVIDTYNLLADFGIKVLKVEEHIGVGEAFKVDTTATYFDSRYRKSKSAKCTALITANNLTNLYDCLQQFYALLYSPGIRSFIGSSGSFSFYCKDGVQVSNVRKRNGQVFAELTIEMMIEPNAGIGYWGIEVDFEVQ